MPDVNIQLLRGGGKADALHVKEMIKNGECQVWCICWRFSIMYVLSIVDFMCFLVIALCEILFETRL
jgi:hypothetical protein